MNLRQTIFVILTAILSNIGYAQNAKLKGMVGDCLTRNPIQDAMIIVQNQDSSIVMRASTDENGKFVIDNMVEAKYMVRVEFEGYMNTSIRGIVCQENKITFQDIYLRKPPKRKKRRKKKNRC